MTKEEADELAALKNAFRPIKEVVGQWKKEHWFFDFNWTDQFEHFLGVKSAIFEAVSRYESILEKGGKNENSFDVGVFRR
jgi:hypothetical protein